MSIDGMIVLVSLKSEKNSYSIDFEFYYFRKKARDNFKKFNLGLAQ